MLPAGAFCYLYWLGSEEEVFLQTIRFLRCRSIIMYRKIKYEQYSKQCDFKQPSNPCACCIHPQCSNSVTPGPGTKYGPHWALSDIPERWERAPQRKAALEAGDKGEAGTCRRIRMENRLSSKRNWPMKRHTGQLAQLQVPGCGEHSRGRDEGKAESEEATNTRAGTLNFQLGC